jgi:hypothetical protein
MYCMCANVYCQRVTTQMQLINISCYLYDVRCEILHRSDYVSGHRQDSYQMKRVVETININKSNGSICQPVH